MPASATATKTTGYQVEFSKHPVFTFLIIMNPFNDVTAPSGKWILFFFSHEAVEFRQTFIAQTIKKSICQKGFCFVTQYKLRTAAG
jgi:hypothetical protein